METLMKNLQEQHKLELQEEQLHTNDLANMETLNEREPKLPTRRKYVSIFRIEGEPILPPLMSMEKRRQMQKIKEKAVKIEQRLRERKQRTNKESECIEDAVSETSRSSLGNTAGNVSQRSHEYFEANLKETEESMVMLQDLLEQQQGDTHEKLEKLDCGSNTTHTPVTMDHNQEKLQKLKKSDILIFDNSAKELMQVLVLNRKANLMYSKANKPSHLLLAGVDDEGMTSIPSICLNPPTPLAGNISISENLQPSCSDKSIITESFNNSFNLTEDSSDESFSSMLTHSNERSSSSRHSKSKQCLTEVTEVAKIKKPYPKTMNVLNEIQQYDDFSSECNTPKTSTGKAYYPRNACVIGRSATSPSIKLISSNRSSSPRSQTLANDSVNLAEITLVRSSSFTLEGPSKALIDHMRQQRTINEANANVQSQLNATRTLTRKPITCPLRAHRDTVESKAKKVQKVELKSSKQKLQQKASQSKLAQAAVASLSTYNCTALTQKSSNVIKTKKSPYDTSKYCSQPLQNSTSGSSHLRKSASTPSSIVSNKTNKTRVSNSPMQTPTSIKPNLAKPTMEKETFSQMDKKQKDKFFRLLAQQEEEQHRLQKSFEKQQKLLLEQLNREMATTQIKSPIKSINSLSQKRPEHFQHNQHNQFKLSGFSSDYKLDKPLQSFVPPQQQSPTISNRSFNLSINNSQSQSTHPAQSPSPNTNLSSIISSNAANTSLELSTLSNHTSPDTFTPTNKQNAANMSGNKSSSRRRLFPGDMTTTVRDNDTIQLLSSNSKVSSSYSSFQHLSETTEPRIPSQNGSIRRQLYEQDGLVIHAAATKINACARGFLVRRLFQTEQIQRIVQTIRDTLIFVINLHLETLECSEESNTPANIKLKARLLQQLSSACRTLHLVFFQTSIKERMEIIARDRKRLKTKLLALNRKRTPRIAG